MLRNISRNLAQQPLSRIATASFRHVHSSLRANAELDKNGGESMHNATLERIKRELEADKAALKWRTLPGDSPADWNSKLKAISNSEQTSDFIVMMQQPIDISPEALKSWWKRKTENKERFMQQYIPQRIEMLGVDLGAAHFTLYRGGAVKFVNHSKWMRATEEGEFDLPRHFHPDYKVEALRCDNMKLYYEGLENLRCLQYLKFLSFHNVTTFDDWCLDRVSGSQYANLEILDISGTKCTLNGLTCLYRIPTLKLLVVDDPKQSVEYELTCSMLEEALPNLKVVAATAMHDEINS